VTRPRKLAEWDVRLISQLKSHRENLRDQLNGLSNRRLAKKFKVSHMTIARIPEWGK
jgi:predicted transcriptional regulator